MGWLDLRIRRHQQTAIGQKKESPDRTLLRWIHGTSNLTKQKFLKLFIIFLPGYQMLLQGYVQFCGPTHPPCVAVVMLHQQILTGQANALLNSGLLERGPRTRNLSGACSSFSTWCRSVSCVESGLGEPGSENAFACAGSTRAVRTR